MIVHEYGDAKLPKMLLLHPMLADGASMLKLVEPIREKYCVIAPDFSGQGEDEGEFGTPEDEAKALTEYFKQKGYRSFALMMGASLGGRVALELLADRELEFKTTVLDGAPLYRGAWMMEKVMAIMFLKKQKKAKAHPGLSEQKMSEIYGPVFGPSMGRSFERMSETSLRNIVRACADFSFYPYPREVQERIFFEFGSKEMDGRQSKLILKEYPHVHIRFREGCGHCEYMAKHHQEYSQLLEAYMNA